jgi:hypothetical protein
MLKSLLRGSLSLLKWGLCGVGAAALLLTALVATPVRRPPELQSISQARGTVDFSALPAIERYQARDGSVLGFRHYPANDPATGRAAIVVHGSSGSSGGTIHALSAALAARGVETWAVDVRTARRGRAATSPMSVSSKMISSILSQPSARPSRPNP